MDNLQFLLLILGGLAILVILLHEFLWSKKERTSLFKTEPVVKESNKGAPENTQSEPVNHWNNMEFVNHSHDDVSDPLFSKREHTSETIPGDKKVVEQKIQPTATLEKSVENKKPVAAAIKPVKPIKEEIFVLHVTGMSGKLLRGDELLTSLLQSGLRFGEMNIFHRHVDISGGGSVLFSVANMIKPGTFYLKEIPEMMTPGISFFLLVPSFGDAKQNFKLMLQTAQRIADDVSGIVLDDQRRLLTPQKIVEYNEKIKALTAAK